MIDNITGFWFQSDFLCFSVLWKYCMWSTGHQNTNKKSPWSNIDKSVQQMSLSMATNSRWILEWILSCILLTRSFAYLNKAQKTEFKLTFWHQIDILTHWRRCKTANYPKSFSICLRFSLKYMCSIYLFFKVSPHFPSARKTMFGFQPCLLAQ